MEYLYNIQSVSINVHKTFGKSCIDCFQNYICGAQAMLNINQIQLCKYLFKVTIWKKYVKYLEHIVDVI